MTTVGSVQIVKLSEIAKRDKQALDKAVSDNEADITGVQAAIMANSALKSQLDAEMVETSAIVAASMVPMARLRSLSGNSLARTAQRGPTA